MNRDVVMGTSSHNKLIRIEGFSCIDEISNMMSWLGRGKDYRRFIIEDLERELYEQDSGSQLISITLEGAPKYETKLLKKAQEDREAIVSRFVVMLPINLIVKSTNGDKWKLKVELKYKAINIESPEEFKLTFYFDIVNHQQIK